MELEAKQLKGFIGSGLTKEVITKMVLAVDEDADVNQLLKEAKQLVEDSKAQSKDRVKYFILENDQPVPAEPTEESNSKALILQKIKPILAQIYLGGKLVTVDIRALRDLDPDTEYTINGKSYPVSQLLNAAEISRV